MRRIAEKLRTMIDLQSCSEMNENQTYYVAGLADALQVVEDFMDKELVLNRVYFVIMFKEDNKNSPYITKMRLYKISRKSKLCYCFTEYLSGRNTSPDLILYSIGGLSTRVFSTQEAAEQALKSYVRQ